MLIGYVSDERYVALPGVRAEFIGTDGSSTEAISRASGSLHADLPAGDYEVVLAREGFGSKRVRLTLPTVEPLQFRLLTDTLLGYAWPKWVASGQKAEFRVHSPEAYHLSLWRYGREPERVQNLGWFDEHGPRATVQITPDGDYTQTGVEWNKRGYANPHHLQYIEAPARSGLYYFHARTATGRAFSFPWIVAPARPTERVAVLASNMTWNAYNSFGGRSNYIHADRLPPTPTVNSRLDLKRYTEAEFSIYDTDDYAPLSFDRPEPINHIDLSEKATDPIEGRSACHLAPAEWRLLAWLEREGFGYDFYAETQLDDGQLPLDDYRVLMISTHPEYWTRRMYDAVRDWVFRRGGRLMYLGGNGINALVERSSFGAMTVRNGAQGLLPAGRESRFHLVAGVSEASLLGVVFTDSGVMTAAPYRVHDSRHWAFEGTGLKAGDLFGIQSLHRRCEGGASGHETDKISPSSPPNVHKLAVGLNRDEGGAQMVIFDTESGGAVFSAGSITYPSSVLVDEPLSKLTANVLRRFTEGGPIG